ncbi:PmoA family protein [Stieleria sp. JC731]|uniref:DUF6807 domain-containing protein n=1 Tax=Pirellulaceae TaxID=2691357 RepID=UPI001E6106CD|nr:PmoA family protein [Stieleria sp. JC731]MCC9598984.1 PmoA family protein [Stieleria sp. JC731]
MNRILALALAIMPVAVSAGEVKIVDDGQKAVVTIDGQPFTEYRYSEYAKPILYPVIGPGGKAMTRNYPMVKDVDNEASDHPHHKSIWYTHDDVNGIRFWMEETEGKPVKNIGKQIETSLKIEGNRIVTTNDWQSADGEAVCTDKRVISFGTVGDARYIDYEVTWIASSGDLLIGDTKEGTMGIRTNPNLRLKASAKHGNHTVSGHSINSEGVRDGAMWGKRAAWVDYWGEIDGDTVGVAIFDHPSNPRHPTWWHARDYGLIAANPFGVHDFEGKEDGTGDMTLKAGGTMTFKYRFLFHPGDVEAAKIEERYQAFAK